MDQQQPGQQRIARIESRGVGRKPAENGKKSLVVIAQGIQSPGSRRQSAQ